MSQFWKLRILTFIYGFSVAYLFTGSFNLTSKMYITMVIGNTIIMKLIVKENKNERKS